MSVPNCIPSLLRKIVQSTCHSQAQLSCTKTRCYWITRVNRESFRGYVRVRESRTPALTMLKLMSTWSVKLKERVGGKTKNTWLWWKPQARWKVTTQKRYKRNGPFPRMWITRSVSKYRKFLVSSQTSKTSLTQPDVLREFWPDDLRLFFVEKNE